MSYNHNLHVGYNVRHKSLESQCFEKLSYR